MKLFVAWLALLHLSAIAIAQNPPNPREKKILSDRDNVTLQGYWIYNDLPKAFAEAKSTGKPLVVVLRCVPCEECVKLDDELLDNDKRMKPLLEQFVRVRVISTNGLDLSLFQFDYDQSFAVFFLNADGTVYGRYGTRSHRTEWKTDVSIDGLAAAMTRAISLHRRYPENAEQLKAKTGPAPMYASPEKFPSLKEKYTAKITFEKDVVKSCIHCHQIGDAIKEETHKRGPMLEHVLSPYPHPKSVGLIIDPKTSGSIAEVTPGSAAATAGLKAKDDLLSMNGQPLLSMADMQWVLHHTSSEGGSIPVVVNRDGKVMTAMLKLNAGWRSVEDISWRALSWGLRRMALGGMKLDAATPEERQQTNVPHDHMLLSVKHVGQFGPHAAAQKAGFRKGDFLIAIDGKETLMRETDILREVLTKRKIGDIMTMTIWQDGKKMDLKLPVQ